MRSIVGVIVLVLVAACSKPASYDLVVANGRVMDPESGLDAVRHVGISAGKIAAVSEQPLQGTRVIDAAGIVVERPPPQPAWHAVLDRLTRAAAGSQGGDAP